MSNTFVRAGIPVADLTVARGCHCARSRGIHPCRGVVCRRGSCHLAQDDGNLG